MSESDLKAEIEKKEGDRNGVTVVLERLKGDKKPEADSKTAESAADDNDGQELRLTLEEEETLHDDATEPTGDKLAAEDTEDDKTDATNEATKTEEKTNESSTQDGSKDDKDDGESTSENKQERRGKVPTNSNPKVVWISNVAQNTRASELKSALSAVGKVTGAKVVVNARVPGSRCFGYVTMGSVEDADAVIAKLNNTELNGQIIKIDKFDDIRAEQMKQMKMTSNKSHDKKDDDKSSSKSDAEKTSNKEESKDGEEKDKEAVDEGDKEKNGEAKTEEKGSDTKGSDKDKGVSPKDKRRPRSRSRGRTGQILTFNKIREERERQRLREKERMLREEGRRRHEEALRQRDVERRQRHEAQRLEREREKLRMEREKIEKEKAELIRMERERQRLEREKIKAEKIELQRTLTRLEEDRRAAKRPAPFRENYDERKRPAPERPLHFKEPPPPPRFDQPISTKPREPSPNSNRFNSTKDSYNPRLNFDKKHEAPYADKRGGSNTNRPYDMDRKPPIAARPAQGGGPAGGRPYDSRDARDPRGGGGGGRDGPIRSKDGGRFPDSRDRDRSPHGFRGGNVRDDRDRRPMDNKSDMMGSRDHRYPDNNQGRPKFDNRNQSSGGWNSHQTTNKFSSSNNESWNKDSWRQDNNPSDRWNNSQGSRTMSSQFSGNSNSVPVCPPPPGLSNYPDRFDYNKSINPGMRKY